MTRHWPILLACLAALTACQPTDKRTTIARPSKAAAPAGEIALYVNSQPLTWRDLRPALVEHSRGAVVTETILSQQVKRRLAQRGLQVNPEQIADERTLMLATLNEDPNQAQRMLNELRVRNGLGEHRFGRLMERNAGLRLLVNDDVVTEEAAVRRAYDRRYGPSYETRLIVVPSASQASQIIQQAKAGRSFIDLAVQHSTDESRAQGGMVGWISPADGTWPIALREALKGMSTGDISPPIALDSGFAVLQVVNKSEAQAVAYDDVKDELERLVRLDEQRRLMQQLMRALLDEADVTILDSALKKSYEDSRRQSN